MTKRLITSIFALLLSFLFSEVIYGQITKDKNANKYLVESFKTPPDSIQTSCYWYWISNNVSEEGVIKDLNAMKQAGINRAFIGNIGLADTPYGKVKMLTEEWWSILHTALKTATHLGIDIGIFNSPGWSQSGGPWVGDEEAMKYFTSSKLRIHGSSKISQKLEIPVDGFHDICVIAYPVPPSDKKRLNLTNSKISTNPEVGNIDVLFDENEKTGINFPEKNNVLELNFKSDSNYLIRYISISPTSVPINASVDFYGKDKTELKLIKSFNVDRYNPNLAVGFNPFAPVVETFSPFSSNEFKLIIKDFTSDQGIAEIEIGSGARIERYAEKTFAKMYQNYLPYWETYQWENQELTGSIKTVIDPDSVIDISDKLDKNGVLSWDIPSGEWIIERVGFAATGTKNSPASPEATGFEVDKMSKKHVAMHFKEHIGEVLKRIPEADRKSFKVVVQDSYEMGGQNYTDDFFKRFKKEYGYSAYPFLPVFSGRTVKSQDASDRFLWDLRRFVANMIASEYVGGMKEISNKHGLTTWLENYGHWGFPSESLLYGSFSDEISGEYWAEGDLGNIENRIATSCGHIYGKNKTSAESYTCGGNPYGRTPAMIKQRGDRFFAEGINNSLLHVFITQPDDRIPGINAWFGTEFNRTNTWFSHLDLFTAYLKRVNFMLQQGKNVADVAYFIGEDAPKMTGKTDPLLPHGYQFDYVNNDIILNYMTVKDGLLTLNHGTQYRILVLPKLETMRPELLKKIKQLVNDGAVVLGPAPIRSPSLQNQPLADREIQTMAKDLWGSVDGMKVKSRCYGKGMILNGLNMSEAFALINCTPDCKLPQDKLIHYGHRKLADGDIYFLTNQSHEQKLEFNASFRISGKIPELWHPVSGQIRELKEYEKSNTYTKIPLVLHPNECVFIVFRINSTKNRTINKELNFPERKILLELNEPWIVEFNDTLRGTKKPIVFNKLTDWSKNKNDTIKYYSGVATYKSIFTISKIPDEKDIILNFSKVGSMAKVKLNGIYAGGVWTPPYEVNISEFVKKGSNLIEIEVVNTWVNRLIGDQKSPKNQRTTWTVHYPEINQPLQPSGLFMPLVIESCTRGVYY